MSLPAGFTADLLPVGIELLGGSLADMRLVSLAYAFEQSSGHRRAPATTPALIDGAPPTPISFEVEVADAATGAFVFDPADNTLSWTLRIDVAATELHGATLHAGVTGDEPSFARLAPMGVSATDGTLTLSAVQRRALERGELWLRVFTRADPLGLTRGRLTIPGR